MSSSQNGKNRWYMDVLSVQSERELDNLHDIRSTTDEEERMASREGQSFDNYGYYDDNTKEHPRRERPLRPGTGIPPHHPQKLKKKSMSRDSVFAIDVANSHTTDPHSIPALPEPQTDIPVFSVTSQDHAPWQNKTMALESMDSEMDSATFSPHKRSSSKRKSSRDRKRSKKLSKGLIQDSVQNKERESAHIPISETESSPSKSVSYNTPAPLNHRQSSAVIYRASGEELEAEFLQMRKNSNASGIMSGEDHTDLDGSNFLRYKPKIPLRHLTNKLDWHFFKKSENTAYIDDEKINQRKVSAYVTKNILQRECSLYVWDKKPESTKCVCGRKAAWHANHGKVNKNARPSATWHQKTHTQTMRCDSFGEIQFRGFGCSTENSPYVRADYHTDPSVLWELMISHWKMPKPRLLISVTGGAQFFQMKDRMKSLLKQGLVDSAVRTGAWIITGGTNTGVMKLVGEAVKDHVTVHGNSSDQRCVALAIATWGIVTNRLALDGEEENGLFPATYAIEDVIAEPKRGNSPLDINHTHFILVDNGTEGQYGKEIELRSKLEAYISAVGTMGVSEHQVISTPVVLIVVEGGIGTLTTIEQSLRRGTPVVIVRGSGRVADYVAVAYEMTQHPDPMKEDVSIYPGDFKEKMTMEAHRCLADDVKKNLKIDSFLEKLRICLDHRNLINIFDLEKSESVKDIDRAILCALLKAKRADCKSQVALALAWNRCDIARQQIFTAENIGRSELGKWMQSRDMYDAMFTAIVQNRADFVKLFIDNGVDLKKFLTAKTLWNIYCNCLQVDSDGEASILRHIITARKQGWIEYLKCQALEEWDHLPKHEILYHINTVLIHLLRDESFNLYPNKAPFIMEEGEEVSTEWKGDIELIQPMIQRISKHTTQDEETLEDTFDSGNDGMTISKTGFGRKSVYYKKMLKKEERPDFESPERDLFIFAALFNRRDMARLFLQLGKDQIGTSLVGYAILKALSDKADLDEETTMSTDLLAHAQELETFATAVLSECYSRSKSDAHMLLTRTLPNFGNTTLLTLADKHEIMNFAEHASCQTKLSEIWKGCLIMHTSELKILLTLLVPPLVVFLKFNNTKFKHSNSLTRDDDEDDVDALPSRNDNNNSTNKGENSTSPNFAKSKVEQRDMTLRTMYSQVRMFDCRGDRAINPFRAFRKFYKAPVTKFYANIISYLVYLSMFSYFLLTDLRPVSYADSPSVYEIVVWIWSGTLIFEEVRQFLTSKQKSLSFKFRNWWANTWNQFDLLMYVGVVTSIILRYNVSDDNFVWVRVAYSLTLTVCYLRLLQFFFTDRNMGPKVIMIRKMLVDLMFFFLILMVFVLSFGVAYHSNMYPNAPVDWAILYNVLYYPYFQIYGELFLENIKGDESGGCTNNETIWRHSPMDRCAEKNAIGPIFLAVYMILTNILLVNLLIAMFSYTFQMVQENSTKVWRFYRISLVYEYFDRPSFVPPIIILNHLWRCIRHFIYWCNKKGHKGTESPHVPTKWHKRCGFNKRRNQFRIRLPHEAQYRLSVFEKVSSESHLTHSSIRKREQLDSRVASTSERLDLVMGDLQRIKEVIQHTEANRIAAKVKREENEITHSSVIPLKSGHNDGDETDRTAWNTPRDDQTQMRTQLKDLQSQMNVNTDRLTRLAIMMEQLLEKQERQSSNL